MNETPINHETEAARRSDTQPLGVPTHSTNNYPPPPSYSSETPHPAYSQPQPPEQPRRAMGPPLAGPVILIAAGIVLLLNNLDILPWAIWGDLWRLWPLALIVVGLDLILGRRKPFVSLLIILLVVGIGGALILYTGFATRGAMTGYKLDLPLGNSKSANVQIDFGTGELLLDSAATNESLASGLLDYYANRQPPKAEIGMDDGRADVTISASSDSGFNFDWFGPSHSPEWDIHLSPRLPMSLNADLGTGNSTLDLSGLNLTNLDINVGTGNTIVTFPKPQSNLSASIDGGVGNLSLSIPEGVEARIFVDTGIGNVNVDSRFTKESEDVWVTSKYDISSIKLDLKIDAGVGNVDITK